MKTLNLTLLLVFSTLFGGCNENHSAAMNKSNFALVQPTAEIKSLVDVNTEKVKVNDDKDSFECIRAEPEPIINKKVFPNSSFRLEKNKEFPFQNLGYETVEFKNGDKLLIENVGCENYTLILHFQTARFSSKTNNIRFWYKAAAELIAQANKGIREPYLIKNGLEALNSYIKKNKRLKFAEEIDFGGSDIRDVVSLNEVKKLKNNRVEVVISFGTGPL